MRSQNEIFYRRTFLNDQQYTKFSHKNTRIGNHYTNKYKQFTKLILLTLSYFSKYIYVQNLKTVATPVRIYTYTDFAIEIWGIYRHLTDTLRYQHTRCSRASGLWHPLVSMFTKSEEKWSLLGVCPLFLASFDKLQLADQVQFIAGHGIQWRIIWIFCRESEVTWIV